MLDEHNVASTATLVGTVSDARGAAVASEIALHPSTRLRTNAIFCKL
jgi:hypothetical protein